MDWKAIAGPAAAIAGAALLFAASYIACLIRKEEKGQAKGREKEGGGV